ADGEPRAVYVAVRATRLRVLVERQPHRGDHLPERLVARCSRKALCVHRTKLTYGGRLRPGIRKCEQSPFQFARDRPERLGDNGTIREYRAAAQGDVRETREVTRPAEREGMGVRDVVRFRRWWSACFGRRGCRLSE